MFTGNVPVQQAICLLIQLKNVQHLHKMPESKGAVWISCLDLLQKTLILLAVIKENLPDLSTAKI